MRGVGVAAVPGLAGHLAEERLVVLVDVRDRALLALDDLIELTAVQEDAAALATGVDLDPAAVEFDELAAALRAGSLGGHVDYSSSVIRNRRCTLSSRSTTYRNGPDGILASPSTLRSSGNSCVLRHSIAPPPPCAGSRNDQCSQCALPALCVVEDERRVLAERVEAADDRVQAAVVRPVQRSHPHGVFRRSRARERPDRAKVRQRVRIVEVGLDVAQLDEDRLPRRVTGERRPSTSVPSSRKQQPSTLIGWSASRIRPPSSCPWHTALDRRQHEPLARPRAERAQRQARLEQAVVQRTVQAEAVARDLDQRRGALERRGQVGGGDARDPRALGLERSVLLAEVRAEHVQAAAEEVARLGVLGLAALPSGRASGGSPPTPPRRRRRGDRAPRSTPRSRLRRAR